MFSGVSFICCPDFVYSNCADNKKLSHCDIRAQAAHVYQDYYEISICIINLDVKTKNGSSV